jgi:hypothetical protein
MLPLSSFQVAGVVEDRGHCKRVKFDDDVEYLKLMQRMATGSCVVVTVEEEKAHRSKTWPQVKYWKGHVCPLVGEHCGYTDKQADLMLLGEKFGYIDIGGGHQIPKVTSIADLSVEEMTELIEWALDWVPATLEVILLPPDKNWKLTQKDVRRGRTERLRNAG